MIENSLEDDTEWERLEEGLKSVAMHERISEKMKMRCFLIYRDNVRTHRLLQENLNVDLYALFSMGKMNLLQKLVGELVKTGMDVQQRCPSLHMRPAALTPLMLAAGAGHTETTTSSKVKRSPCLKLDVW